MSRLPALLALVLALLAACVPSQHDEARWGTVRVRVEGCLSPHLAWADEALSALAAVGPTWQRVEAGEDVVLRCEDLSAECPRCAGRADLGGTLARIDEGRVDRLGWLRVAQHELLHTRGLVHVCRYESEDPSGCSPVGYGDAVMAPEDLSPDAYYPVPIVAPTELDLAEWNRVHGGH